MSEKISIPTTTDDITLEWLNLVMNQHKIQVTSFVFEGDAKDGRGYLSSLNRIKLQVLKNTETSTSELSILLKSLPSDAQLRDYIVRTGYCQNELQMYTRIFPDLKQFLDDKGVPENMRFAHPFCYFGAESVGLTNADYKCILVLEDLTADSFHPWAEGAKKSFDWEHTCSALKEIALFHGNIVAMKIFKKYETLKSIYPYFINPDINDPALDHYIKSGFQAARDVIFAEDVSLTGKVPEGLIEHLNYLESNFKKIAGEALWKINPSKLNAIRHGDLHCNNVLFTKNRHPAQAKWIDFQAAAEGQPMLDLSFFLSLSCEPEFSTTELDKTLTVYFEQFMSVIKYAEIDFDYSFEKLQQDFKNNRLMSILHIISGAPVWCCGPSSNTVSRQRLRTAIIWAYEHGELQWPN